MDNIPECMKGGHKLYHSITFGDLKSVTKSSKTYSIIEGKNTWEEWGLIPTSRPLIAPPAPNKNLIEVPGRNGALDMSTILTGYMTYKNRTGTWDFVVDNKMISVYPRDNKYQYDWQTIYLRVMSYLHGKTMKCVLEDDKEWYYEGMFNVNAWKSDKMYSTISIDYDLHPFKYSIQYMSEPWLWDPFNFETGVITIGHISVRPSETVEVSLPTFEEPYVIPYVYTSENDVSIVYNDVTIHLSKANQGTDGKRYPDFKITKTDSMQTCEITNTSEDAVATVKINYRRSAF